MTEFAAVMEAGIAAAHPAAFSWAVALLPLGNMYVFGLPSVMNTTRGAGAVALKVPTKRKAPSQFVPFLLSPVHVAYVLIAFVKADTVPAVTGL